MRFAASHRQPCLCPHLHALHASRYAQVVPIAHAQQARAQHPQHQQRRQQATAELRWRAADADALLALGAVVHPHGHGECAVRASVEAV